MQSRLPPLDPDRLTEEQDEILETIRQGPRGNLSGPFLAWIHSPELCRAAQSLGLFCRYRTRLPARLSELAILHTACQWQCQTEWLVHFPIAVEAGLDPDCLEQMRAGETPAFSRGDENLVYRVGEALYRKRRLDPALHATAIDQFGVEGLVELVAIQGYYALVAMTLNAFDMLPPGADRLPFSEP